MELGKHTSWLHIFVLRAWIEASEQRMLYLASSLREDKKGIKHSPQPRSDTLDDPGAILGV